jgi:hypothetical protein
LQHWRPVKPVEARRIAANIAKLLELLRSPDRFCRARGQIRPPVATAPMHTCRAGFFVAHPDQQISRLQ